MKVTPEPHDTSAPEQFSFEQILERLEQVVERLESGELPLERSLSAFEEGVRLTKLGAERLDEAERRVEELLGDGTTRPLASVEAREESTEPR